MASREYGGYDEDFVKAPDDDFKCPVCFLVAKDPVLTRCGHLFCGTCYQSLPMEDGEYSFFRCPVDREKLDVEDIFPDARTKRKILQLKVRCKASNAGCKAIFELSKAESHHETCGYVEVCCPNKCGSTMQRSQVANHKKNVCSQRLVDCRHCSAVVTFSKLQSHLNDECQLIPVDCPQCSHSMPRFLLPAHRSADSAGDCPYTEIACSYSEIGCKTICARKYMDVHMQDSLAAHTQLLLVNSRKQQQQHLEEIKAIERKHELVLTKKEKEQDELVKKVSSLEKRFDELRQLMHQKHERFSTDVRNLYKFLAKFTWKIEHLNRMQSSLYSVSFRGCCDGRPSSSLQLEKKRHDEFTLAFRNKCYCCRDASVSTQLNYVVSVRGAAVTGKIVGETSVNNDGTAVNLATMLAIGKAATVKAATGKASLPVIALDRIPVLLIIDFTYNVVHTELTSNVDKEYWRNLAE